MGKKRYTVDCLHCTGHGMGLCGEDSVCIYCKGRGYFELSKDQWTEYCNENNLDIETGEEIES